MCSGAGDWTFLQPGFPIRKSTDHSLVIDSPWLIADSYVLLRFLVPRHPPCALKNLTHKDARVHCVVLNIRAEPHHTHPPPPPQKGHAVQATGEARTESHRTCVRALRTQQRARHHPPHTPTFQHPPPKGRACT